MNLKNLYDRVLFAISVPKCICCKQKLIYGEEALCKKCSNLYAEIKTRNCSRCSKVLSSCDCTNKYLSSHYVKKVIKCFRYINREENLPANSIIYSVKKDNRKDVIHFATDELLNSLKNSVEINNDFVITNVPRKKSRILYYGFDHSEVLARNIAKKLNINYVSILTSKSKLQQKQLAGVDRVKNIKFEIKNDFDLTSKKVIIVDDIITTGASMGTAASLLRSLGAKDIYALTLGIAYKDWYDAPVQ